MRFRIEEICGKVESSPSLRFSADLVLSLQAACERLDEYPRPLELATEHLLLGLAAADHEVGIWLRERGLEPELLEVEIHTIYGHQPGPLSIEEDEHPLEVELEPLAAQVSSETSVYRASPMPMDCDCSGSCEEVPALRVFDAAANRAREGLRAVEDYVRFVLDDRHLTKLCKQLRHDLATALARVPMGARLAARDTRADVGTSLATASEGHREDATAVLHANCIRAQEALRSLEEFGKTLCGDAAAEFEQLRYRAYTLQRAIEITRLSADRLGGVRLYVLIDGGPSEEAFADMARVLVEAGVHAIQLRDKQLQDRQLLCRARRLRELTQGTNTLLFINDRPDLAALCHADGVHVGQEELSVKDARTIVGPDALVGVSTHTLDQARQAQLDGANYIGVGPVFASRTKQFDDLPGPALLRSVAAEVRVPSFAIGGITPERIPEILATGVRRIAVSAAVTTAADPADTVARLLSALDG